MNPNLFLQQDGNILPAPARLAFRPRGYPQAVHLVSSPNLRIFSEPDPGIGRNLYDYAVRHQQANLSVERLAFAALAGSGIAGILAVLI